MEGAGQRKRRRGRWLSVTMATLPRLIRPLLRHPATHSPARKAGPSAKFSLSSTGEEKLPQLRTTALYVGIDVQI